MLSGWTIVLDVGKTLAKLTLWDERGTLVERRTRNNQRVEVGGYIALDVAGIEAWVAETLSEFSRMGPVAAIVPVGHGAAAAILRDGKLACPPLDYEFPLSPEDRAAYDRRRDAFAATGSPALPAGLNLGAQLDWLEKRNPDLLSAGAILVPWPQYWAWLLCGVAAAEVSSLGCHTDLWRPAEERPSAMAAARGWADRLAPLRRAGEVLGAIAPDWAKRTGLSPQTAIYCGLHDSNAALLAARGFAEIASHEATILSTGTWFVAMRSPADLSALDFAALPESRDCLVNVDVEGRPIPSARFMGGREAERLVGEARSGAPESAVLDAVRKAVADGDMVLPTLTLGVGPFPASRGRYEGADEATAKGAAASLYLALVTDASLDLIGARERLLIEGRFADDRLFVAALAALRPDDSVFVSHAHNSVPYGALRLLEPTLKPPTPLSRIAPLPVDLAEYKARWQSRIAAEAT